MAFRFHFFRLSRSLSSYWIFYDNKIEKTVLFYFGYLFCVYLSLLHTSRMSKFRNFENNRIFYFMMVMVDDGDCDKDGDNKICDCFYVYADLCEHVRNESLLMINYGEI